MNQSEEIAQSVFIKDMKHLMKEFKIFLSKHRVGFAEELFLIKFLLQKINRRRKQDYAIISFRKIKGVK